MMYDTQYYQDFILFCKKCEAFNQLKKDQKVIQMFDHFSKDQADWMIVKMQSDWYKNDLLAFVGFGADTTYQEAIFSMLEVKDTKLVKQPFLLQHITQFMNNNSIVTAFDNNEAFIKQFLKKNKLDSYGRPRNWAKLLIALDEKVKNEHPVIVDVVCSILSIFDFETTEEAS